MQVPPEFAENSILVIVEKAHNMALAINAVREGKACPILQKYKAVSRII